MSSIARHKTRMQTNLLIWAMMSYTVQVYANVITGGSFSMVLTEDGNAWATGQNNYGQLGDGTTTDRNTFTQAIDISDVQAVAAGFYHSVVLKTDGTVWSAGRNSYGQLGDGTTTEWNTFTQAIGISDVHAVAAGIYYSVVLKTDGTVWGTGKNGVGQLGDGTTTHRNTFTQAIGISVELPALFTKPEVWRPGPFIFTNDSDERAICRQRQSEDDCVVDDRCSWNRMLSVCNERGYQPLIQTCSTCTIGS